MKQISEDELEIYEKFCEEIDTTKIYSLINEIVKLIDDNDFVCAEKKTHNLKSLVEEANEKYNSWLDVGWADYKWTTFDDLLKSLIERVSGFDKVISSNLKISICLKIFPKEFIENLGNFINFLPELFKNLITFLYFRKKNISISRRLQIVC